MTNSQQKAWAILTNEERTALTLSLAHGKSTWESGEIMGKAHYKYLEIRQRSEKFMKLFSEYFDNYERLIPIKSTLSSTFKKYITLTIEKRLTLKQVLLKLDNPLYLSPRSRDLEISREINKLSNSNIAEDINLYHLIKDFDRWNNYRILPLSLQEPSAFKRRNKHKLRKLVNVLTGLHPLAILKIKQLYAIKKHNSVKDIMYLPLVSSTEPKLNEVIKIPRNEKNMRLVNSMVLYTFYKEEEAIRFLNIISKYIIKEFKHCKDGQEFWPEFRILTKNALNYEVLQNITPNRKYVLDSASRDTDLQWYLKIKEKSRKSNPV